MANAIVDRLGQINQEGNERALFLKVFAGEVLTSFARSNMMLDKTTVRTITHGKSASFPVVGKIGAEYHVPGTEITGLKVNRNEVIINIDDLLISHVFIADIDEAMNHYDVRSIYSTEMGRKLAMTMDQNIFKELIKTARSTNVIPDFPGGTELKNDKFLTGTGGAADKNEQIKALTEALYEAAKVLDEKDIPSEDRHVCFRPSIYYTLAQNLDYINSLYGGTGSVAEGNIVRIAGFQIHKSNNLPNTDDSVKDTRHGVDATKTIGVSWTKPAVGTVKLMDLSMQSEWDIRRQGTLMVARYAVGHGMLRPECSIELKLDATAWPVA